MVRGQRELIARPQRGVMDGECFTTDADAVTTVQQQTGIHRRGGHAGATRHSHTRAASSCVQVALVVHRQTEVATDTRASVNGRVHDVDLRHIRLHAVKQCLDVERLVVGGRMPRRARVLVNCQLVEVHVNVVRAVELDCPSVAQIHAAVIVARYRHAVDGTKEVQRICHLFGSRVPHQAFCEVPVQANLERTVNNGQRRRQDNLLALETAFRPLHLVLGDR